MSIVLAAIGLLLMVGAIVRYRKTIRARRQAEDVSDKVRARFAQAFKQQSKKAQLPILSVSQMQHGAFTKAAVPTTSHKHPLENLGGWGIVDSVQKIEVGDGLKKNATCYVAKIELGEEDDDGLFLKGVHPNDRKKGEVINGYIGFICWNDRNLLAENALPINRVSLILHDSRLDEPRELDTSNLAVDMLTAGGVYKHLSFSMLLDTLKPYESEAALLRGMAKLASSLSFKTYDAQHIDEVEL